MSSKKVTYLSIQFGILIILFGVIIRLYYFLQNPYLYMDDCSLALNIIDRNFVDLFRPLLYTQKAPPLFLSLTFIFYKLFGISEYVFRIIPIVFSILSLFLFHKVCEKYLEKTYSILFADFLFAINTNLIYYSHSFKQYSSDVFCILLFLLFYKSFELDNLTKKQFILYSLAIMIISLFSIPFIFVYCAYVLIYVIKNFDKEHLKKIILFSIPFFMSCLFYKIQFSSDMQSSRMLIHMWKDIENCGFLSLSFSQNFSTLKQNMLYFFAPNENFILVYILIITGFISYFIKNNKNKQDACLFVSILFVMIFLSVLYIYPFSERVILFLLPICIILIAKNLDLFFYKNIFSYLIIPVLIFSFHQYDISYFDKLKNTPQNEEFTFPKDKIKYIFENINADEKLLVLWHYTLFEYYRKYYESINKTVENDSPYFYDFGEREKVFHLYDELEKGKIYWIFVFYLPDLDKFNMYSLEYFELNNAEYKIIAKSEEISYYLYKVKL